MPNLTAEQQQAVRNVVKSAKRQQITSLSGHAGTGKTTCLTVISDVLDTFAICAFTGKASSVLRKKGMDASTIHSLIYKPVVAASGKVEFKLKEKEEATWEGFLVDEASMISQEIYNDLLSFDLPIVFVGDHGQLEPVGTNINLMANPMFRLETVHRNAGEICYFAEHLRKGYSPRSFANDKKVIFVEPSGVTNELLLNSGQMICAYNKTRVAKNKKVRELMGRTRLVEVGELVMCLRNNKSKGLFNGMQGVITRLHPKHAKFDFRSDGLVYTDILYDPNQFGKEKNQFEFGVDSPEPFDYANCISCHKSQGAEWDDVLVFEQKCELWEHKRWTYTSASRAKEKLIWVCPPKQYVPAWL